MELAVDEELEKIASILKSAKKYGLESEVIWSAMKFLKEFPESSIEAALLEGLVSWDI